MTLIIKLFLKCHVPKRKTNKIMILMGVASLLFSFKTQGPKELARNTEHKPTWRKNSKTKNF